MRVIEGETYAEVYTSILSALDAHHEYLSGPRGLQTKEVLDLVATINKPFENLWECSARPYPKRYLAGELAWYFSGRDDLNFIGRYSKFWKRIANPDGTINSAYGKLIFGNRRCSLSKDGMFIGSQWQWAYESLVRDRDTRQAIIRFNDTEHQYVGNKDFVCTMYAQFFIRNNMLNMTVHMRSSDAIKGITFDFPFFMLLQQQMGKHLSEKYPGLRMGYFRFIAGSCHVYEQDFQLVKDMLAAGITPDRLPKIEQDMVDKNGNCNRNVSLLTLDVTSNDPVEYGEYVYSDDLVNWIWRNAKSKPE